MHAQVPNLARSNQAYLQPFQAPFFQQEFLAAHLEFFAVFSLKELAKHNAFDKIFQYLDFRFY